MKIKKNIIIKTINKFQGLKYRQQIISMLHNNDDFTYKTDDFLDSHTDDFIPGVPGEDEPDAMNDNLGDGNSEPRDRPVETTIRYMMVIAGAMAIAGA